MSDSLDITPENSLSEALDAVRSERPDKSLVLLLWDDGGRYDIRFFNAGMSLSQCVALLEINKQKLIKIMTEPTP